MGFLFQCTQSHTASPEFEKDMESKWTFIPIPNPRQLNEAKPWVCQDNPVIINSR